MVAPGFQAGKKPPGPRRLLATLEFSYSLLLRKWIRSRIPKLSSNGSGMYLEFLLRRAHSRSQGGAQILIGRKLVLARRLARIQ